jgi:hypothetical protein
MPFVSLFFPAVPYPSLKQAAREFNGSILDLNLVYHRPIGPQITGNADQASVRLW